MKRPLWNGYCKWKATSSICIYSPFKLFLNYSFRRLDHGLLQRVVCQKYFYKGIFLKALFSIGYFPKGTYQRFLCQGYFQRVFLKGYFTSAPCLKLLFPMVLSFTLIFFKYTFPKPLYKNTFLKALSKRYLSRVTFPQRVLCPNTFPAVLLQWDTFLRQLSWGPFPKVTFPKIFFSSIFLLLCLLNYQFLVFSSIFYNALKPFSWWGKHCNNFSFQKESCIQVQIEINFPNFSLILI